MVAKAIMNLTEPDENGVQILSGKMKTLSSDKMSSGFVVQNYEQYVDLYFNNPQHLQIDEETKEAKIGGGAVHARLFISGNVTREE